MATTYFFTSSSPLLNGTKSFTSSNDQDFQDVLNWAANTYNASIQAQFNPANSSSFVPTNGQIGTVLAQATMKSWDTAAQKFKKDSSLAAVPTPPPGNWSS